MKKLGLATALIFALTLGAASAFASAKQNTNSSTPADGSMAKMNKHSRHRHHRRHHRKAATSKRTTKTKTT